MRYSESIYFIKSEVFATIIPNEVNVIEDTEESTS